MEIYLVRHGLAKSKSEDASRPLADEGIKIVKQMANALKLINPNITEIYHSQKLRAQQTAEIFYKILLGTVDTIRLIPDETSVDEPDVWIDVWMKKLEKIEKNIMIVGHIPHLILLAGKVLTGKPDKFLNLDCSDILCLKRENSHWKVKFLIGIDEIKHLNG